MTDNTSAQRAREWLERQLEELGHLRNASRRDPGFKAWRQNTLTVLQRIWPEDVPRIERFRRIPFSPPMTRPTERQSREYFGRGWGEAGQFLRSLLSEVALLGLRDSATLTGSEAEETQALALEGEIDLGEPTATQDEAKPAALPPKPAPTAKVETAQPAAGAPKPAALQPPPAPPAKADPPSSAGAPPVAGDDDLEGADPLLSADEIGREMAKFMSTSPVFRKVMGTPAPVVAPLPTPAPVVDLTLLATELETLDLDPDDVPAVREALLAVARAAQVGVPEWPLVRDALRRCAASPTLARRAVPLLMEFAEQAA